MAYDSKRGYEAVVGDERKRELARFLVQRLVEEARDHGTAVPVDAAAAAADPRASFDRLWLAFRALVNIRPDWEPPEGFLAAQDELLQALVEEAGIVAVAEAQPSPENARLRLWRGDITRLQADAIVNAANAALTGCWVPLHYCIDNAIHTFAGVQLRAECAALMRVQGCEEPTARAKVTGAGNLPARHVIHTVGPVASGRPTPQHRAQLAQSYRACLDAAAAAGDRSVAFPCISTGVFGFPQDEAAPIAVAAVHAWLDEHPDLPMTVVFDVFSDTDEGLYRGLLGLESRS